MRIGIAISTYTEDKTDQERYIIIERSLSSLESYLKTTKLDLYVVIVVDGSIPSRHNDLLNKYNFNVYFRKENGGVARTKNTSIRLLLEQNIDYGFLMDDDVEYKKGCFEKYVDTMIKTGSHHMSYCQMPEIVHPKNEWSNMGYIKTNYNGIDVMKHGGCGVGCLLSFTPELINKIGYFKVMKGKYGYEHINFTHRAIHSGLIPYVCDIMDSSNYIDHIGFEPIGYNKFKKSHSISENYRKSENNKNRNEWMNDLDKYELCEEYYV